MTVMALHCVVAHFFVFITLAAAYPSVPVSLEFPSEAAALQQTQTSWQTLNVAQKRIPGTSHPDITQVFTTSPVLGPDYNVRQDPPPSEDELQVPSRRRRQAPIADAQAEADDDSDMYLEPDDEPRQEAKPSQVVARYEYGLDSPSPDSQGYPQHFFPSFAPVFSLGHSRPPQLYHQKYPNIESVFLQEPEVVYKPRVQQPAVRPEFNSYKTYRDSFQLPTDTDEEASTNNNLLGSGNFGVIRGGTYYNDEDRNSNLNPYYNNGHGRPYVSNPRPQKYTGGDFFANFRDFAEINTPAKASFSEYVIVYVNKNGTELGQTPTDPARPKNIIEQLSLLDKESESEDSDKKLSSHKRKLAVLRRGEEAKWNKKKNLRKKETVKDLQEPLLALS